MANINCECCGAAGAKVVPAPSGGTMEACGPCERIENEQAAIDALAYAEVFA